MGKEKHNRKVEWMNNTKKELQGLEEGLEADILLELLIATLTKVYFCGGLRRNYSYVERPTQKRNNLQQIQNKNMSTLGMLWKILIAHIKE